MECPTIEQLAKKVIELEHRVENAEMNLIKTVAHVGTLVETLVIEDGLEVEQKNPALFNPQVDTMPGAITVKLSIEKMAETAAMIDQRVADEMRESFDSQLQEQLNNAEKQRKQDSQENHGGIVSQASDSNNSSA